MTGRRRDVLMAGVAVVAVVLAAWCWNQGTTSTDFAPIVEGAPDFTGTHWSGPWIGGACAAVAVAGLAVLDIWRRRL
ncbi:hypothetical protein [Rhodococcus gannanensis]|uniref:Uncharacterized protein n=1 Tax=Rhodococcus gannanensis TaxID=1960308 RepID=A0ABW4PCB3_9NOCA